MGTRSCYHACVRLFFFLFFLRMRKSTHTTSALAGMVLVAFVTVSLGISAPRVHAAEPSVVQECAEAYAPEYREVVQDLGQDMRESFVQQWNRQIGFRVRAARQNRKAGVQRTLQTTGRSLPANINQVITTQVRAVDADITALRSAYTRLNEAPSSIDTVVRPPATVAFGPLNTTLLRLERALRVYANATDRAIITRVWNETRREYQAAFQEGRDQARAMFIENMQACIYDGVTPDQATEAEEGAASTEEEKGEAAPPAAEARREPARPQESVNGTRPAQETRSTEAPRTDAAMQRPQDSAPAVRVTRVNIDNQAVYLDACKQQVVLRANVFASGKAMVKGYFLFHDGVRSPEMTLETDATGQAYAEMRREFTPTAASSGNGTGQFIVVAPEPFSSIKTEFAIRCQATASNSPSPSASASPSALKADVQLSIVDKSDVQACVIAHRFQFLGTISYGGAGTVQYYWLRSDGSRSPLQSAVFEKAGSKSVTYDWGGISASLSGSVSLVVTSPNEIRSTAYWRFTRDCPTTAATTPPAASTPSPDASKEGTDAASSSGSASPSASPSTTEEKKEDDTASATDAASGSAATIVETSKETK